jgi:hypothetical protein
MSEINYFKVLLLYEMTWDDVGWMLTWHDLIGCECGYLAR